MKLLHAAIASLLGNCAFSTFAQESKDSAIHFFKDQQVAVGSAAVRVKRGFLVHSESHKGIDFATSYHTPPGDKTSPVYSRVARIQGDEVIFIGGIAGATNKDPAQEVTTLYDSLERIAALAGTDLRHLAKATYYVSDDGASAALNELRPGLYDPARPPAASKVKVPGVGLPDRGILIDMIAAPAEKAGVSPSKGQTGTE